MLHLGHCESRRPLGPENVEADGPVTVDVGVVDPGGECKFWRFEGVVRGEVNGQEEYPALVGTVGRSHDRGLRGGDDEEARG